MSKVLIVDDSQDSADLLAYELCEDGYDVQIALTGDEGIAQAASWGPDIILLDMRMPGLNGLEVLPRLKRFPETDNIPIIMFSASRDDQNVIKALDLGAHDYVNKPIELPVLMARMRAALRLKQATEALEEANIELKRLATTDPLTHLYNRRHFFALSHAEFSKSVRHNRPLSFIMLDVDEFKSINDTYGHSAGDQALHVLAECCQEAIRESDIIGRIGGEEFAICCPDSNLEGAHAVAERLRTMCEEKTVTYEKHSFQFTVSLGVTSRTQTDLEFDKVFNRSDQLLYQAKKDGRNRAIAC